MAATPGGQEDDAFHHAETVDAYPRLSDADLDRIDRQRRQRRTHRSLRTIASAAGGLVLLAAVGVMGWRVTNYDSHQAPASMPQQHHVITPAAHHHPSAAPASSLAPAATTPPAATTAPTCMDTCGTPQPVLLIECNGNGVTQPASYTLACGDGNGGLSGMTWSTWTTGQATGTGQYYENDCQPDCASGTFVYTPVTVVLSAPVPDDPAYFADMHVYGGPINFTCTANQDGGMDC